LLKDAMIENDLIDKPGHIYNMDETGLQMGGKVGKVIATKGAKEIYRLTGGEKEEL
jgi:hypothetical protein